MTAKVLESGKLKLTYNAECAQRGIYEIRGSIKRIGVGQSDDEVLYYHDYGRDGYVEQSETVAGKTRVITAEGFIEDATTLEYGYFREEASGWLQIQEYSTDNKLNWTPQRAGVYNIQVRLRENEGIYEKVQTVPYTIEGAAPLGELEVLAINAITGKESPTYYYAGIPYNIVADYTGTEENMLFRFTLYEKNTGITYLSNYQTSNAFTFIPKKNADYRITVRAILDSSFGLKQIDEYVDIKAIIRPESAALIDYDFEIDASIAFENAYNLPNALASYLDSAATVGISLSSPSGQTVTLGANNSFTAAELGAYKATYTVTFDGETVFVQTFDIVSAKAQPSNLLQGFDGAISGTTNYIIKNNGDRIDTVANTLPNYVLGGSQSLKATFTKDDTVALLMESFMGTTDLSEYKSITINMRAGKAYYFGAVSLVWGGKAVAMTSATQTIVGWNQITIPLDWNKLEENGWNGQDFYSLSVYLGCTTGDTLYFDNITFEYKDPDFDFAMPSSIVYNTQTTLPIATMSIDGIVHTADITVTAPDGSSVILDGQNSFMPLLFGGYTVLYEFKELGETIYSAEYTVMSGKSQPQNLLQGFDDLTAITKTFVQTMNGTAQSAAINTNPAYVNGGTQSLAVTFSGNANYQFLASTFFGTKDFSQYKAISIDIYAPASTAFFTRYISAGGTEYNMDGTSFTAAANKWTTLRIPLDKLTVSADNVFCLRVNCNVETRTLYFDNITFELKD